MTVEEIVKQWLTDNGYDGLFNDECGCELKDLGPCGEMTGDCTAGYKVAGCCCGEGCAYHILPAVDGKIPESMDDYMEQREPLPARE